MHLYYHPGRDSVRGQTASSDRPKIESLRPNKVDRPSYLGAVGPGVRSAGPLRLGMKRKSQISIPAQAGKLQRPFPSKICRMRCGLIFCED